MISKHRIIFILLLFGLQLLIHSTLHGQGVAVVLSGGGSRGMAHVGVLKALEENNIPIDYIAGTSIGAAVGALYASGYSPREIEKLFELRDFDRWINKELDPGYSFFYAKDDPDAGWIDLKLDFSNRYSKILPKTVKSPIELDYGLMEIFAGASAVSNYNFDSLMIPFRCIAADIDSSQAVTIKGGSLANAVRASITFPFLFKPIEIDGKLLFDGGIYNNFPADIALEQFNPAVIIGSKVSGNYPKPDPDDVLSQIQNMIMTNTNFNLDTTYGVLIEPPVEKVNLTDFSMYEAFIQNGYTEAIGRMDEIKRKVSTSETKNVDQLRKDFNRKKPPYFIDSIHIEGLSENQKKYVYKSLIHKSKQLSLEELKPYYFNLTNDSKIKLEGIRTQLNKETNKYNLFLKLKPANKFDLKFGGNLSSRLANQAFVEVNYRYLFQDALHLKANVYFGKFYTSALLGGRIDFPGKIPLYTGLNFVYNRYDYFKSNYHFFEDETPSFLIQDGSYLRLYAGVPATNKGKVEAELTGGLLDSEYYQDNVFSREDTVDQTKFNFVKGALKWELNSLNRKQYASSGARFRLAAGAVTGDEEFISGSLSSQPVGFPKKHHDWFYFDLLWDNYFETIGPIKLGFYGRLYFSTQNFFSNYTSSLLAAPAFEPIPESKTLFLINYRAYDYGAVGLKLVWNVTRRLDLRGEMYVFQPYEQIMHAENNTANFGDVLSNRYWMGTGAIVYHTFFGPISLSVNYFDNPDEKFFVALNIGYIIFNRKAMD